MPETWAAAPTALIVDRRRFGSELRQLIGVPPGYADRKGDASSRIPVATPLDSQRIAKYGFPLLSLQTVENGGARALLTPSAWRHGLRLSGIGDLPLMPIWPGFAANWLFWTAVAALPRGVRELVRRRRVASGPCGGCGHQLGGPFSACPECGGPASRTASA